MSGISQHPIHKSTPARDHTVAVRIRPTLTAYQRGEQLLRYLTYCDSTLGVDVASLQRDALEYSARHQLHVPASLVLEMAAFVAADRAVAV